MKQSTITMHRSCMFGLAVLAIFGMTLLFLFPKQAWAASVSTPDEFVEMAKDPSVASLELETNLDMTGKSFIDVSGKTIDLGGFAISSNNFSFGLQGSDFVVKNGIFKVNEGGSYALFIGDGPTSNVTIENVMTVGGINVYNSTDVVLRDVVAVGTNYYSVWCDEGAQVVIESGKFSSNGVAVLGLATGDNGQRLDIEGGEFVVADRQPLVNEQGGKAALPVITGGTFNTKDVVKYVPQGYAPLMGAGLFTVMNDESAADQAVSLIDGIYCKTLDDASAIGGGSTTLSYKVVFSGEGVMESTAFVDDGETIAEPAEPTRDGYHFEGWFCNGQKWVFGENGTKVTGPVTLIACWSTQYCTVTFDYGFDFLGSSTESVKYGSTVAMPTEPTIDGWEFEGWFSDASFEHAYDFSSAIVSDLTLYAKWSKGDVEFVSSLDDGQDEVGQSVLAKTGDKAFIPTVLFLLLGISFVMASFAVMQLRRAR